jgi:AraC-like DNA-binding protein
MPANRVAATYVQLLYEFLQREGVDAVRLLGPATVAGQDSSVLLNDWQAMLAAAHQACPLPQHPSHLGLPLGLAMAQGISPRHFGVVGYAALACANLGEALRRLERYHALVYDINLATLSWQADRVCIDWGTERGRPGQLADETALAALVQLARNMTGTLAGSQNWPLLEMWFVNPEPADRAPYDAFFGCPVRFGQTHSRIAFASSYLALPLRKSDPDLLALLDQQAEALLQQINRLPATLEPVRQALVHQIREGRSSLAALAKALGTSERTLQRKLAAQDLSFQALLNDTRRHLAQEYLRNPALDLAEIALMLGYSEQSAFTRAFRDWCGCAPGQWRTRQTPAAP